MVSVVLLLIALQGLGEFCVMSMSSRSCQFLVELGVLVCPVGGILTHPGTLCPGTTTTLNCSTTGTLNTWDYENELITVITSTSSSVEHTVSGVDFTVSVLSTSPEFVSQIRFVASVRMNGTRLQCLEESVTLLVEEVGGKKRCVSSPGTGISTFCLAVPATGLLGNSDQSRQRSARRVGLGLGLGLGLEG